MPSWNRLDQDFADLGPVSRTYGLQLTAEAAERRLEQAREQAYRQIEDEERQAGASGRIGSLTSPHERVEHVTREERQAAEAARAKARTAQEEVGGIAYCVAAENLPKLEKKLATLNRKADKLGTEPISLVASDERQVFNYEDESRGYSADFEHVYCLLKGSTPKVPGFEFIATIQHTEAGNILRTIPPIRQEIRGLNIDDLDLSPWRNTDATCDHCKKIRSRKDTYLIFNSETQEIKQIGRTCLRDFTGLNDPEKVAAWLEFYFEVDSFAGSRGEAPVILTDDFLAHCALMVRLDGFKPASFDYASTKASAMENYWSLQRDARDKKTGAKLYVEPTEQDNERAKLIRNWGLNDWDENNDFALNVKTALANDVVRERTEGILAAAFIAYDKAQAKAQKQSESAARRQTQTFVGEVGKREDFTLTLKRIIQIEDNYSYEQSTKPLFIFEDDKGNAVKWFASRSPVIEHPHLNHYMVEGGTYEIKATVKKHEDDERYGKSTLVSRAKVLSTISEPADEEAA